MSRLNLRLAACVALLGWCVALAQTPASSRDGIYLPTAVAQTETDEYTRYELLAPGTASFRISYEVTATTAGAKFFYNPIRKGSVASDERVYDAHRGTQLHFEVVSGATARQDPLMPDADPATDYIRVTLAAPVPEHGQARLLILKTYQDPKSYYLEGKTLVFDRPLGVKRNKIVLPPGYEVVGLSVPAQIRTETDGRIAVSGTASGNSSRKKSSTACESGSASKLRGPVRDRNSVAVKLPSVLGSAMSMKPPRGQM